MQMNKVMKSFIIALPVVTMMACSSGPSEEELAAERNRLAQEQAAAEAEAPDQLARRAVRRAARRARAADAPRLEVEGADGGEVRVVSQS